MKPYPKKYDYEEDDDFDDDYYDDDDAIERAEEERIERQSEYAATCRCGAWKFNSKGEPVHVADCCCGAE